MHRNHTSVFLWKRLQLCWALTFIHFSIILPSSKTHRFIQNFHLPKADLSSENAFFEADLRTKWLFIHDYWTNRGLVGITAHVRIWKETECPKSAIYKISAEWLLSFTLLPLHLQKGYCATSAINLHSLHFSYFYCNLTA